MRAPLSWLKSLTPLPTSPTDQAAVAELAAELDSLGLVVESVDRVGEGLGDVIVARVLEIAAIEGADRIRRVVVDGGAPDPIEVVCGAWNFQLGDLVPLAPVGSELPGGFRIERRKMRGVVSNGMICSARELALGDDHAGIMILGSSSTDAALGMPVGDFLGIYADIVFDLAVEPNRPDCFSMLGVARDLAARLRLPLHTPAPAIVESGPPAADLASVEVLDPELCFRLTGRVITNLEVVPSPLLIQRRLTLAGMRPIDCLVDASNYVLLELGQPTHPYDLDKLAGHGLRARAARSGETLVTLDGVTRTLGTRTGRPGDPISSRDCVICDATDVPMGIGGVMGGHLSEISAGTRRVLLEAAEFLPVGVGRTARHLGLRSEASVRFERGIDPLGIERASARVAELVVEAAVAAGVAPPVVAPGLADACPRPFTQGRVSVRSSRVNALLGTDLSADEMTELLEPIGYRSGAAGAAGGAAGGDVVGATLELKVPSFRPDVQTEVDVIEDVARTYGYGNIARTERRSPYVGRLDATQLLRRRLKRILCGLGAHEAWTSSIVDPADHARAGWEGPLVRLTNPMVAEESALRAGLLAGLLAAVRHNTGHRHPFIRLFEIGDVFGAPLPGDELPAEPELVALILAGEGDGAVTAVEAWHVLADALGVEGVELVQSPPGETEDGRRFDGLHATRSAALVVAASGMRLGTVGEVDPSVLVAFGLPHERIGWLEIDMARLAEAPRRALLAKPVSRYPSSDVDLAFVVDADVLASKVESALRQAAGELCESIDLFDVYRGAGVGTGKRSLAYRLRFCALDHTLTDGEVGALREECIKAVEARLPAVLRS